MLSVIQSIIQNMLYFIMFVTCVVFLPGLPPNVTYPAFELQPPLSFDDALKPNDALEGTEKLLEGQLRAPESFAIWDDEVYTGVLGGDIVRVSDGEVIAHLGPPCKNWKTQRHICSQPLGIRFNSEGTLYVADTNLGLTTVDIGTGRSNVILPSSRTVDGKPVLLSNDLDITDDGTVYMTVSSTKDILARAFVETFGEPSGYFLKFNPERNETEIIMDGLHFPNGVQISKDKSFVLMCETLRYKIYKHHLEGPLKGQTEVFAHMPGPCDNIRINDRGNYFIGIVAPALPGKPELMRILGQHNIIRRFILKSLYLVYLWSDLVNQVLPNSYTQALSNTILSFDLLHVVGLAHPYGLFVELNNEGKIVRSYHSPTGKVSGISQATQHGDYIYLGSPYNYYVGKVFAPNGV